ncbi:hypothetical protein BASA50_010664 [Batrachochytrium salamandrivorans]|uniref:U6 small nuclear RNA (adenine-(43)-N(6))-methyltransferase n=1 Tax=Batrachochytrium salamandrivorans TaxID=1357716 RepID=A0ABQ8F0K0_9FUNG|nr:hypothetical protein BASA62_002167 [Batrachochytrium salamandrivorans]KAH6582557.1 hypothetical protein BASA61_008456 [Batrachochytrium salamandrivorans]KAH6583137.1 hypothetical protein BASA60_001607 [Batrachochytrium salamandrivorans]KAH6588537.1 hypothetical protein BASA50_010664 [Batrachochytrium salamandrivorans]KAH9268944.1 hypothetical protein BASA83_009078 [Batrachochytrium salamandrivorans]
MHPRSPFNQRPDFGDVAERHPRLKRYLRKTKSGWAIEFSDPKAMRELTCALLSIYFGILLEIPLDSLCPPVPNRLDYILHIEDLVSEYRLVPDQVIRGIDIGTGASCIYPLLGCKRNPTWHFLALEIDDRSIEFATNNVNRNKLKDNITIAKGCTTGPILVLPDNDTVYDFCMCNPPFYKDDDEMRLSRSLKKQAPPAICMGSTNEMLRPGGELSFVASMISESQALGPRIRWYTSLVGFMENAKALEAMLIEKKVPVVHRQFYRQGQTTRSVLSWSFIRNGPKE